jgi:hypothetical protein
MKMLLKATLGLETFNNAVRDGTAGPKLGRIVEDLKPEQTYFYEDGGKRTALLVVDVPEPSRIPALAEPFFLTFDATSRSPGDDSGRSGQDRPGAARQALDAALALAARADVTPAPRAMAPRLRQHEAGDPGRRRAFGLPATSSSRGMEARFSRRSRVEVTLSAEPERAGVRPGRAGWPPRLGASLGHMLGRWRPSPGVDSLRWPRGPRAPCPGRSEHETRIAGLTDPRARPWAWCRPSGGKRGEGCLVGEAQQEGDLGQGDGPRLQVAPRQREANLVHQLREAAPLGPELALQRARRGRQGSGHARHRRPALADGGDHRCAHFSTRAECRGASRSRRRA